MLQSENIGELAKALCEAQKVMRGALKDSVNPHFKSRFADLESVMDAIREPLTAQGISVTQGTAIDPQHGLCVVTQLSHPSNQWMRGFYPVNAKTQDPQGQGSGMTYARRYALASFVGVVQVDDDGEAAMDRKPTKENNSAPIQTTARDSVRSNGGSPARVSGPVASRAAGGPVSSERAAAAQPAQDPTKKEIKATFWELSNQKLMTVPELQASLSANYNAKQVDDLTDAQATELLGALKAILAAGGK